ncbi:MAG: thioredoxin family protein [Hyphomicrobium sp.]|nr:thioredoxin family protein [Hyphomicrobium sp.]MBN9279599.1 thioredoxin family protein [Hyphomicrobium sp.]
MMRTRREMLTLTGTGLMLPLAPVALRATEKSEPPRNDDGLHTQPWFHESFLDLKEDLTEAEKAGKSLAVMFEQRGCPYCKEMHVTNLSDPEIASYIQKHFLVVQLNLYGARTVTDFDGKELEERALARRWGVNFTPTIYYFVPPAAALAGKDGGSAAAWKLIGYWKPFHFHQTFAYVHERAYAAPGGFQKWLGERAEKLRAEGKDVRLW